MMTKRKGNYFYNLLIFYSLLILGEVENLIVYIWRQFQEYSHTCNSCKWFTIKLLSFAIKQILAFVSSDAFGFWGNSFELEIVWESVFLGSCLLF